MNGNIQVVEVDAPFTTTEANDSKCSLPSMEVHPQEVVDATTSAPASQGFVAALCSLVLMFVQSLWLRVCHASRKVQKLWAPAKTARHREIFRHGFGRNVEQLEGRALMAVDLGPGDIAFTGLQTDAPDSVSFVLLKNVDNTTTLTFTDNGWATAQTGFANTTENTVTITFGSSYAAGTHFVIRDPQAAAPNATGQFLLAGTSTSAGSITGNLSGLSASGDSVLAYQGTAPTSGAATNWVAGINSIAWGTSTGTNFSALPSALTLGTTAVGFTTEVDNQGLSLTNVSGNAASIRTTVNTATNWTRSDTLLTLVPPSTTFTVSSPTIAGAATTAAFTTTYGTASAAQAFSVSGSNLTANLVATAPSGFEVSSDGTTFGNTATFPQTSGSASGTLSIRLAANAPVSGSYNSQNIVLSSTGATSVNITTPASGSSVSALALTLGTATVSSKVYDGTTSAGTASVALVGVVGSDVVTASGAASFANKNVGTGKSVDVTGISLSGAAAGNYSLAATTTTTTADITAKALIASATGTNKTYDGNTTTSVSLSLSGIIGSEDVTVSASTAAFADKNVGIGKTINVSVISLAGADAGNYSVNATTTATADISALAITGSVTANNKVFDGTTAATIATRTLTGAIGGDDVSLVGGTAVFASSAVGTGITVDVTGLSLAGADAGNYTVNTTASTTADITAPTGLAQTITFNNPGPKTYGDASFDLGATASSGLTVSYSVLSGPATISGNTLTITGAGSVTVRASQAGDVTYNPATPVDQTFSVAQATLTPSISGTNKTYDGTTSASVTYSLTGIINSDDVTASGSALFASKNVGTGIAVDATGITLGGAAAANYVLSGTTASTTADISAKALTATITASNKTYDATDAASVTYSLSGIVGSEDVSVSGTATFADKNVGTGKTVTASGLTLSGSDAGNYTVNASATGTANITAAALVATATGNNKVYDGNTSATVTIQLSGVLGSDTVSAAGTGTFADRHVAIGKSINVTGISLAGIDAANYTVNATATATADVTPLAITATVAVSSKNFDGTNAALINQRTLVGVISPDVVTVSGGTATFDDLTGAIGLNKPVTTTGLVLAGANAGNYTIGSIASTASIGTGLVAGDIAFIAFQADNSGGGFNGDAFQFVLLRPVVAGTTIFCTDNGYQTDVSAFRTNENIVRWVAQADLPAGTKVTFTAPGGTGQPNSAEWTGIAPATGAFAATAAFGLAGGGDNIAALQNITIGGTEALNGTAIAQITFGGAAFAATFTASSGNATTAIAPGLTDGLDAVSITATDNGRYNEAATGSIEVGTRGEILASINNDANWLTSGTPLTPFETPATFTVLSPSTISITSANKEYDGAAYSATSSVVGSTGSVTYTYYDGPNGTGSVISAPTSAGSYSVVASVAADASFAGATSTALNFTITQKALTASVTGSNKVYDRTTNANVSYSLSGVVGSDDVSASGTASFADKNVGAAKTISVSGITLSGAAAANYSVNATATASADITALAITGNVTVNNKVFDGNNSATIATRTLTGVIVGDLVNYVGGTATFDDVTGAVGTAKPVSVDGLSLDGADAGNYTVNATATTTADITSSVLSQTITFNPLDDKTYGDADVTLTATSDSGLPVTFSVISGPATISGSTLTITGAGSVVVEATQAGNASYSAATPVQQSFTVAKKSLTAIISGGAKIYDGTTDATVTINVLGLINSDDVSATGTASFDNKNAGTGKTISVSGITLSGVDANDYSISATATGTADISAASLIATGTAANKTYDGNDSASVTITLSGVIGSDVVTGSASGTFADKNAGTGKVVTIGSVTLAGADAANYTVGSAGTATADISAASLIATATAANKTYDGNNSALVTISLTGVIGSDVVTGSASGTFADKNAGSGKVVTIGSVTLAGADAANYTVGSAGTSTADISAASLIATGTAANKTYDGNNSASVTISLTGVIGSDVVTGSASGTFADKNAGTGKAVTIGSVTLAGADAANYTVGSAGTATADITAASLTATGTAANKTYDGNNSASVTITLSGVIGSDVVTGSASGTFADKNAGSGKVVTIGSVTLLGADAANYTVGSAGTATADIAQASLTATGTAADKVFDGSAAATVTITLTGVVAGDVVTGSATGTFSDALVGNNKTVTIGTVTLAGADAANYTVGSAGTTTASITAVPGAPVVNPQTFLINSKSLNNALVGNVVATGLVGETLTYAITNGNASGAFSIDSATGAIRVADAKALPKIAKGSTTVDAVLTVSVTNDATVPLTSTAQMTVTLSSAGIRMNPTVNPATFTLSENNKKTDGTTKVGAIKPLAAYSGQKFTFNALSGTDAASFNIDAKGGITLASGVALNFEVKPTYSFNVNVADSLDPLKVTTQAVTLNVKNLNEAPVYTLVDGSAAPVAIEKGKAAIALDENIPGNLTKNGLVIGTLTASDVDAGTTLALQTNAKNETIVMDKTGAFGYNTATGQISIIDETKVSFENKKAIKLSFIVTDDPIAGDPKSKAISTKLTVTVNLNDLNEAPVISSPTTFSVGENNKAGAKVGSVKAKDADTKAATKQTLTYSIFSQVDSTGGAVSLFSIDAKGGITIPTAGALNFEASPFYTLVVRVADSGTPGLFTDQTITINVLDLNEASSFALQDAFNAAATSLTISKSAINNNDKVGRLLISDVDAGAAGDYAPGAITAAVEAASKGALTYNELTGDLFVKDKTKLGKTFDLKLAIKDTATKAVTSKFTFKVNVNA